MNRRRSAAPAAALVALLAVAGLTACGPDRPDAQDAADALAVGLSNAAGPDLGGDAAAQFPEILGDLAETPRTVVAGEVVEGEGDAKDTATVPLTWTFDLGEGYEPFTYETEAAFTLVEVDSLTDDEGREISPALRWDTEWSPTLVHPSATATTSFAVAVTEPARGDIVTTDGTPIVTMRDVWNVGIDKTRLDGAAALDASARQLAAALEIDADTYAGRVSSAGERAFVVAITIRQSEADIWDADALAAIPGVLLQEAQVPLGPTASWARPVLGRVGEATAEIIENSGGEIEAGDLVGYGGLQAAYEEQLRGTDGLVITLEEAEPAEPAAGENTDEGTDAETDASTESAEGTEAAPDATAPTTAAEPLEVYVAEPVDGAPLMVTLDVELQTLAEEVLADIGPASAIAVVRPSTGEVLVLASGPGSEGYNTAALAQHPPGSTFKIATALALLRAGYTPDHLLQCTEIATVDGREFHNFPGYPPAFLGDIPLSTAIAQSCNNALINEADAITAADVAAAAASLGIGTPGEWAFPYFPGAVPADATGTAHAASLIGQGGVVASPLAMATVAASVAAGETVTPVLLPEIEQSAAPTAAPLTSEESAALAAMMREVVTSGTSTILASVPGEPVHAKSGTAEFGAGEEAGTHGWMIAYQGDLAVAAFVATTDDGGAGSAGPIVADFLTAVNGG